MTATTLILRQMPKDLNPQQRLLLLVLSNHFVDGKPIEISINDLVEETAIGERTVIKHLGGLVKTGYVIKRRVGLGESNVYHLDFDAMNIDCSDLRHARTRNPDNVVQLHQVRNAVGC
ncbi:TPA: hypothetical protein ACGU88_000894 [Vibrio vulnificus]